jgi:hypothetical protein
MQPFLSHGSQRFYRMVLVQLEDFASPFRGSAYPCLVWNHGDPLPHTEAQRLAEALLESNCRYVVSAGTDCEAFHDAVDQAFIRRTSDVSETVQDRLHVMTTWHPDEPMDDTTFFFAFNTQFDDHDFHDLLVVHINGTKAQHGMVEASLRKEVLDEAAL